MSFEEILKEKGLYVGDDFAEGVCFKVAAGGYLYLVEYASKNDWLPKETPMQAYAGLFTKTYRKILNRNQLFKDSNTLDKNELNKTAFEFIKKCYVNIYYIDDIDRTTTEKTIFKEAKEFLISANLLSSDGQVKKIE